ncbi:RloB domain-containing protein [Micrococcales bacterium 31B]|nr:RloB domain-containing protein [Micrococcales bacterium 31B]
MNALKRMDAVRESVAINIEIAWKGQLPLQLVRRAARDKNNDYADIDQYWCIFDVESPKPHPGLEAAVREAAREGIKLAISNPCFELWLILHREDSTKYLSSAEARTMFEKTFGVKSKHVNVAFTDAQISAAIRRSKQLETRHEANASTTPDNNPSTTMYQFIEAIYSAMKSPRHSA